MLALTGLMLCACNAIGQPISSPTARATATWTASPTARATATWTASPTATLTASHTPSITPSPTASATASITPLPQLAQVFDNWDVIDVPAELRDGVDNQTLVFLSINRQERIANIATALPYTGLQTVYFAPPTSPRARIPALEVESNSPLQVFPSSVGNALAFVKENGDPRSDGLYLLDLRTGFSARILAGANPLLQRGMVVQPAWSPDGQQLALAVATGYDMDIFLYGLDGDSPSNITRHGAYDFFPSWSPDGRRLAFVSDRASCPTWHPGTAEFCDASRHPPPTEGQVYTYELASGETQLLSDIAVSEMPYWIQDDALALTSGSPFDLRNPERRIWLLDISSGSLQEIRMEGEGTSILSESWSPAGDAVLAQIAGDENEIVLFGADGAMLARDGDLDFPRYGMQAAWSPDGQRIAIGGVGGQCPYGIRVRDRRLRNVASAQPPPSMCAPQFSPDGRFLAFMGLQARVDGRKDIYVASVNGFGAQSITGDLRGQLELLGWVGGGG